MFGWEFESLPRYAFPLFPTQAYDLRRFGTPGRNGLRNPRELRLAATRSDDRQLLAISEVAGRLMAVRLARHSGRDLLTLSSSHF